MDTPRPSPRTNRTRRVPYQAHGLFGLWIGLVAGYAVVTLIAWLGVWATDWEDVARVARRRAEVAAAAGDDASDGTGTESDWGHRFPPNPPSY